MVSRWVSFYENDARPAIVVGKYFRFEFSRFEKGAGGCRVRVVAFDPRFSVFRKVLGKLGGDTTDSIEPVFARTKRKCGFVVADTFWQFARVGDVGRIRSDDIELHIA